MTTLVAPSTSAKATLCISFALVFLCGVVSGALLINMRNQAHASSYRHRLDSQLELQKLRKDLDLTEEQTRQLSLILDDVAKYYDNVLSDGQTRVMQMLDDKQKDKFQKILSKEGR